MKIDELNALIAAVCPIISINSSGMIVFDPAATAPQKTAAQTVMTTNLPNLNGIPATPPPNGPAFAQAVKTALGGILGANTLAVSYPLFFAAVQTGVWADVQAIILDANTKATINAAQYAAIKTAAGLSNIPITLP